MKAQLIIIKEWKMLFRNRVNTILLSVLLLLCALATWQGINTYKEIESKRKIASRHMRGRFEGQGAVNPHSAAHYGHFVYKPITILSIIDEGVTPYTGNSLRLEAHKQNEVLYSSSQSNSSLIRFGQLRLNTLLQALFPLFIFFVCHNSITAERQGGTLRLLVIQGASLRNVIWAKTIAYAVFWWLLLTIIFSALWFSLNSTHLSLSLVSFIALGILYGAYFFIITAIAMFVSAKVKTNGSALTILLGVWILWIVVMPKASANVAENITPLITREELLNKISEGNKNGIDGHNPRNERAAQFKDSILTVYGVDSVAKLPVNLDGLVMQADEEYHNKLYDKHFSTVREIIQKQNGFSSASSFVNPFIAVRNLSMALCGTDVHHHFSFTGQGEQYRRKIIKIMNDEMAFGGSKSGDWDWAVSNDYWKRIPDFKFTAPGTGELLRLYRFEILAAGCWLIFVGGLIHFVSNRIRVI